MDIRKTYNQTNNELTQSGKDISMAGFKVVGYARTSTVGQAHDDKISIPDQIDWAKQMCCDKGWDYVGEYVDKLPGDTEFDLRPEGSRLLEDAKFKLFNLVLFYHSSRLAREPWVGLKTISLLGKLRIQSFIRNAPMEPVNPQSYIYGINVASEYMNALSLVGDKQDNIKRSEQVTSGFRNLAQKGILVFAPFWLKKVQKFETDINGKQKYTWHWEPIPSKVAVVKRICRKYMDNNSLRGIARELIKNEIPSPTGKTGAGSWSTKQVKDILTNPTLIGVVRFSRKLGSKYREGKTDSGKQKRVFASPDKWIMTKGTNFSGLISEALFNRIQERLKQRGKVSGRQHATDSPLPGLVYCADCQRRAYCKTRKFKKGNKVYIRSNFIDQSYFRGLNCRRHLISAKKLEALVLNQLQARLKELQVSDIDKILESREENTRLSLADSIERIKRQIKSFDAKKNKLMELYLDGGIDKEEFNKQKSKIDSEMTILLQEKSRFESIINDQSKQRDALATLKELLEMFEKTKGKEARKEMLHRIIDKIFVGRNQVEILYHYGKVGTEWLNVNPHPCGYYGDQKRACTCLPGAISRYQKRVSGPILDRIDIHVDVPSVETQKLVGKPRKGKKVKSSKVIQKGVQTAREIQLKRFKSTKLKANSEMSTKDIKKYCKLSEECRIMLRSAVASMNLTARSYFKVIKVARTIADLAGERKISTTHLAEALQYRPKDDDRI